VNLARVIGTVWATRKAGGLDGLKMQLIQPLSSQLTEQGKPIAAFDAVGAGPGELVYFVTQYEATLAFAERPLVPIDAAITGIVDRVDDATKSVLAPSGVGRGEAGA
jgi:ethanolamine utilization protein EutN